MAAPKTIFLTGANSGIGLATTRVFLAAGWNVFATARAPDSATELQALLHTEGGGEGGRLAIHRLDLLDRPTFQSAVDAAVTRFGHVDVLLNNAGFGQTGLFEQLSMQDWRRQFEVNVFGQIELTQLMLAHFHETAAPSRPRSVLFTSSGAASFALPLMSAYCASKAALDLFVESLHHELAAAKGLPSPITAKIVVPYGGVTETNFSAPASASPLLAQLFSSSSSPSPPTGEETGGQDNNIRLRYGDLAAKMATVFSEWGAKSMPATAPAEVIWTAVTDGKTDKLRYFVGPLDGGPALRKRLRLAANETPDSVDAEYVQYMREIMKLSV